MTTLNKIKSEISVSNLRNEDDSYEYMTDDQIVHIVSYSKITKMFRKSSKEIITQSNYTTGGMRNSISSYEITNEEVLNTLRQLFVNTSNSFVKEVVKTVGKSKTFTEKQLEIIVNEIMKYNLTFNF